MNSYFEPDNDADKHHLLGYVQPIIQDDPIYEIVSKIEGHDINDEQGKELSKIWMLLLQISSDDGPWMPWVDSGSLYYLIRKDDLIARRFERIACVMQSY